MNNSSGAHEMDSPMGKKKKQNCIQILDSPTETTHHLRKFSIPCHHNLLGQRSISAVVVVQNPRNMTNNNYHSKKKKKPQLISIPWRGWKDNYPSQNGVYNNDNYTMYCRISNHPWVPDNSAQCWLLWKQHQSFIQDLANHQGQAAPVMRINGA